ncbi:Ubiquitin carboxyl-terminal hydrolase isozyme L1, partial [Tetrabaena socialis]
DEEQAAKGAAAAPGVFYMKQTIGNACGTIAVLHAIGNNPDTLKPAEGSFLQQFLGATAGMSPEAVGKFLEDPPPGAPDIEEAHKAASGALGKRAPYLATAGGGVGWDGVQGGTDTAH